jgi:NADPH2:quinone reductase
MTAIYFAISESRLDSTQAAFRRRRHDRSQRRRLRRGGKRAERNRCADGRRGRPPQRAAPDLRIRLGRLPRRLVDGTLRVPVQKTYDLADAPAALAALSGEHTQGKLAVKVS